MITRDQYTQIILHLPPLMKVVLCKEVMIDAVTQIEQQFKFNNEQLAAFMRVCQSVIAKITPPGGVVAELQTELGRSAEESRLIAREYLGRIALPLEWYIGPVQTLIQELGGDLNVYLAEAKKNFPEVYDPNFNVDQENKRSAAMAAEAQSDDESNMIFHEFEVRLSSFPGRAEILLRLTGLATRIEQAMQAGTITTENGQELIRQLDAVSAFINTQELNPFEIQAVKRKIKRVLDRLREVAA